MKLYTFGYEGMCIDAWVARLKGAGVLKVIDVREVPISRKKGFSKNRFAGYLADAGISYVHARALGCPKAIRRQYKADGDWGRYTRAFMAYLDTQGESVRHLAKEARKETSCLVCFEADFNYCHRSIVARAATKMGGPQVVHLTAEKDLPDLPVRVAA